MPNRTVNHGLVSYVKRDEAGNYLDTVNVFRGETHDFPEDVIARHEPHGAFLPVEDTGTEPPLPGTLPPVTENSSDEEFITFVTSATALELGVFIRDHPELGNRIAAALTHVVDLRPPAAPEGTTTPDGVAHTRPGIDPRTGRPYTDAEAPVSDENRAEDVDVPAPIEPAEGETEVEADPTEVVGGTLQDIANFLGAHPERANEVLAAENERSGGNPRAGVVKMAEAAAQHGAQ